MFPNIEFLGKTISLYTIMALLGVFAAGYYACRNAKHRGLNVNDTIVFMLVCAIGTIFGMHILYGLTNIPMIISILKDISIIKNFRDFADVCISVFGGSVFYGGLLGGILVGYIYGKKKNLDIHFISDTLTPAIPLFHAFGRVGCFLGGCCYGIECPVGFVYKFSLLPSANGVRRFPVQLLEAALNLLMFFILDYLLKKNKAKGYLLSVYILSYACIRFMLEFLRGDELRGIWYGLSTSQWISILLVIVVGIYYIKKNNSARNTDV